MWVKKISKNLNINGTLILEKLIFETNYERFLFTRPYFNIFLKIKSKALVKIDCDRNCLYVSKFKSFNNVKLKLKASNLLNKLFVNSIYLLFGQSIILFLQHVRQQNIVILKQYVVWMI